MALKAQFTNLFDTGGPVGAENDTEQFGDEVVEPSAIPGIRVPDAIGTGGQFIL